MNQYRKHFDHLGQLRAGDFSAWTTSYRAIVICLVVTVCLLSFGGL